MGKEESIEAKDGIKKLGIDMRQGKLYRSLIKRVGV